MKGTMVYQVEVSTDLYGDYSTQVVFCDGNYYEVYIQSCIGREGVGVKSKPKIARIKPLEELPEEYSKKGMDDEIISLIRAKKGSTMEIHLPDCDVLRYPYELYGVRAREDIQRGCSDYEYEQFLKLKEEEQEKKRMMDAR